MKKLAVILCLVLITVLNLQAQKTGNKVVCFKSNMTCTGCENTLTEYLKYEKGVKDLKIDHVSNTVYIEYREGKNNDEDLAKAIEKKGYKADKISKDEYDKSIAETKADNK